MVAIVFCLGKHSIALLLICMCLAMLVRESTARPPWNQDSGVFSESAHCTTDDELVDLCQRCAKLTKGKDAYKTCCSNDLNARKWCYDYVYFGRGTYDFYSA